MPVHGTNKTLCPFLPIYTIYPYKVGDRMLSSLIGEEVRKWQVWEKNLRKFI